MISLTPHNGVEIKKITIFLWILISDRFSIADASLMYRKSGPNLDVFNVVGQYQKYGLCFKK